MGNRNYEASLPASVTVTFEASRALEFRQLQYKLSRGILTAVKHNPLIGITCSMEKDQALFLPMRYVDVVRAAGALPIALPVLSDTDAIAELAERLNGLVLVGGADVPPDLYGEALHPKTVCVPRARVEFELKLIDAMVRRRRPILGICYGHQLLNVAFGGSLIQDIPSQVKTDIQHGGRPAPRHTVRLERGHLCEILGAEEIEVVSSHHQSIKQTGAGVRAVAHAPDGIIEATEFPLRHFVIGIQWHPEMDPESVYTKRLFAALTAASSRRT